MLAGWVCVSQNACIDYSFPIISSFLPEVSRIVLESLGKGRELLASKDEC